MISSLCTRLIICKLVELMGIIEKQATKNVIFSYLGAGLGFLTILWMPHLFGTDENGLVRILVSVSTLLAQFSNLGFSAVTIRLFPYFRNKDKGHHGFLFYALIVSLAGFLICWFIFYLFKEKIVASNIEKSRLLVDYLFYLMPLTFFTLFFNVFDTYLRAGYNSVIGSFTKELIQRIIILAMLALYYFQVLDFQLFMFTYIAATCLPSFMLMYYIIRQKEWHVKPVRGFITKELRKEIIKLSLYSIFTGLSGAIIVNIDVIMVNDMLGLSKTGVYGIAFYFATIILIPARSIYRITSSVVAEAFKKDNLKEIKSLYNKTCNSQLTIGALLFIGIWTNIDNIMRLLPADYASGRDVILYISAGYLVEMATGINQVIIANSKDYRYESYFIFITIIITIVANYLLIPVFGIAGSAMATAFTVIFANIMRFLFLRIKYKMQPYDLNTIKLIAITVIAFLPGYFLPGFSNLMIDILIRSCIVGGIFILLILRMEASPDLNGKIRKNLNLFSFNNQK